MKTNKILHITAHLGGGVGNALATLTSSEIGTHLAEHTIICLEKPEKSQFLDRILDSGCNVVLCPGQNEIADLVAHSDIVQVEWWNHPATIRTLCGLSSNPMRLLVWSHISGLTNPVIPPGLIESAQRFVFSSSCSLSIPSLAERTGLERKLHTISSAGGFENFPAPNFER